MSTLSQEICGYLFGVDGRLGVGSCKEVELEGFDQFGADLGGSHLAGGLIGVGGIKSLFACDASGSGITV
jgi:hypothetical protein